MKKIIFIILFPVISSALTEKEIHTSRNEKYQFVATACEDNSFLRGCFKLSEESCKTEVKKSFEGCWKFLENQVKITSLTQTDWQSKFDGCVLRDVGLPLKHKSDHTASCELPKREIL